MVLEYGYYSFKFVWPWSFVGIPSWVFAFFRFRLLNTIYSLSATSALPTLEILMFDFVALNYGLMKFA